MNLADPSSVGILLHSGYAPLKAANLLDDKDLAGSARKSIAGWKAFYQKSENFGGEAMSQSASTTLEDLPKLAKVIMNNGVFFQLVCIHTLGKKKNFRPATFYV